MGDQQRWFKLWESALSDEHLQRLSPALRWAWAALGAYTKIHGTKGKVILSEANGILCRAMGAPDGALRDTILCLPHVTISGVQNDNGEFTVTWHNWQKYQGDTTIAERVKRLRSKKRGEEKRGEERKERTYSVGAPPTARVEGGDASGEPTMLKVRSAGHGYGSRLPDATPPSVKGGGAQDNGFAFLWSVAPVPKGSKAAAMAMYARVHPPPSAADALRAQVAHKAACDRRGEFWPQLPHLERWLRKRRWEDELPGISARTCTAHGIEDCPGCRGRDDGRNT